MTIKAVSFDLDDTLYDESTFIKSGLYHVSKYLYEKYLIKINDSTNFFHYELSKGRARILDKLLLKNLIIERSFFLRHRSGDAVGNMKRFIFRRRRITNFGIYFLIK